MNVISKEVANREGKIVKTPVEACKDFDTDLSTDDLVTVSLFRVVKVQVINVSAKLVYYMAKVAVNSVVAVIPVVVAVSKLTN